MTRIGGGGVLGQSGINSMALPPIMYFGSDYLKELVLRPVITGKKVIFFIFYFVFLFFFLFFFFFN